jgi:excisionase family DNA binding protein
MAQNKVVPIVEERLTPAVPPDDIITTEEVAKRLKVRPSCIYEFLRRRGESNCIPAYKLGKYLMFRWSEVSAWFLAHRLTERSKARRARRPKKDAR